MAHLTNASVSYYEHRDTEPRPRKITPILAFGQDHWMRTRTDGQSRYGGIPGVDLENKPCATCGAPRVTSVWWSARLDRVECASHFTPPADVVTSLFFTVKDGRIVSTRTLILR